MAKRVRELSWDYNDVQRLAHAPGEAGAVRVKLTDAAEVDRAQYLFLDDEETVRLATRLAGLVGYKLVEA